ncbi:Substance-K receptor [Trichoplax sp. H2]|nr:Substance-K receptor [Trichoplax sp. H2]|eukprot:RDD41555.1 Substance-K receptor [Trichoplax sp. H2]
MMESILSVDSSSILSVLGSNATKGTYGMQMGLSNSIYLNIVYAAIVVLSTLGNVTYLSVIYRWPELRSTNNIFLANLASANLLMALVVIPFHIIVNVMQYSMTTLVLYQILNSFLLFIFGISLIMMMAVNIDRCFAIASPYNYTGMVTRKKLVNLLILTWCSALIIAVVPLIFFLIMLDRIPQQRSHSTEPIESETEKIELFHTTYRLYLMILIALLFLTICTVLICYSIIFIIALIKGKYNTKVKAFPKHAINIRKSIAITLFITIAHLVCLIPLAMVLLVHCEYKSNVLFRVSINQVNLIHLICLITTALNPLAYIITNRSLRKKLKYLHQYYCNASDAILA